MTINQHAEEVRRLRKKYGWTSLVTDDAVIDLLDAIDRQADRLVTVYTVDVGDREHGLWVFEDPDDAAAFYEIRRASGYQADLGDQIIIDRDAAQTIIADEMAEVGDDEDAAS